MFLQAQLSRKRHFALDDDDEDEAWGGGEGLARKSPLGPPLKRPKGGRSLNGSHTGAGAGAGDLLTHGGRALDELDDFDSAGLGEDEDEDEEVGGMFRKKGQCENRNAPIETAPVLL